MSKIKIVPVSKIVFTFANGTTRDFINKDKLIEFLKQFIINRKDFIIDKEKTIKNAKESIIFYEKEIAETLQELQVAEKFEEV